MTSPALLAVRILVIDDDEVDRERVRRLLPRTGIDAVVIEEADPDAGIARLRQGAADVVLLDYHFAKHDGLDVLRQIRELDDLTPIIMLTGHDDLALAVEVMKAGAVDYIPKATLDPQRLTQSLRHALRVRTAEVAARAAHEALRASEELSRRVLEASHDNVKILDLTGTILVVHAQERAFPFDDASVLRGRSWIELWDEEHRTAAAGVLAEAREGRSGRFVGQRPARDGSPSWWDVVIAPVLGPDGRPERLVAASRDVTDQRRQAEFEQQLVGIVSHDLRNPISAMMMAGHILAEQLPPDSPLSRTAKRIKSSGDRATRLIRDLLDFTQARMAGRIPVERRATDIHKVFRQALEEVAMNHADRSIVYDAEGPGEGQWDPDRMAQVVGNLARNAVSYSPPGTAVTVRTRDHGSRIRVEVHNQGEPIAPDVLPTLFQPFKRGARRVDAERSIGLGLFIVREIVAAHEGTVTVASMAAEGTTFTVDVPRT
jgi:sigma-B regulation protein RsbU (phosphoserine phosphatase)